MGTGSKLQPTVYDLSDKSLAAQVKFLSETHIVDIQVQSLLEPGKDEKVRVDNRKHLENTIKSLHNLVHNDLKPILLKERVTKEEQKEIDDKNFFKEFKLYRTLNAIRLRMQIEEAVFLLGEREKLLEKLHHLKEILRKLADAKHAEDVEIAEAERLKFEQEIHGMVMSEIDRMNEKAKADWDKLDGRIKELDDEIKDLRTHRQAIAQKHATAMTAKTATFKPTTGKNPFEGMTQEQIINFNSKYIQEAHKQDRRALHAQRSIAKSEANIVELQKQLDDRIREIKQSVGPQVSAQQRKDKESGMFLNQRNLSGLSSDPISTDSIAKHLSEQIAVDKKNITTQRDVYKDAISARGGNNVVEKSLAEVYQDEIVKNINVDKAREVVREKVGAKEARDLSDDDVKANAAAILASEKAKEFVKENPNIQADFESHHQAELDAAHKELHALNDRVYDKKEEVVKIAKEQVKIEEKITTTSKKAEETFDLKPNQQADLSFAERRKQRQASRAGH
jgi:hypothetical protein